MLSENLFSLFPIIIAGVINGSFVIPARYIKNISHEKVWFYHSIIGLGIIPWIMLFLFFPILMQAYYALPLNLWVYIMVGGIIFGLGQVCFAKAIKHLGIALSFAINLGIGVTIGSLFVVFKASNFFTFQSYEVILAVALIVVSLVFYYFSTKKTEKNNKINNKDKEGNAPNFYQTGWILASLAGVASGFQNITFVFVGFYAKTQFPMANLLNSFWVWPPFLFAAALPMMIGFGSQLKIKEKTIKIKNSLLIILMGLCFTGSLVLYSNGMSRLPGNQKMLGWPILMILIILTSQAWGWIYGEFKNNVLRNKVYRIISLLLLIVSIVILSLK